MTNAPEIFRVAMGTAGLQYTGLVYADGKLHRFKATGDRGRNSLY